jgi:hypothetical protein
VCDFVVVVVVVVVENRVVYDIATISWKIS